MTLYPHFIKNHFEVQVLFRFDYSIMKPFPIQTSKEFPTRRRIYIYIDIFQHCKLLIIILSTTSHVLQSKRRRQHIGIKIEIKIIHYAFYHSIT